MVITGLHGEKDLLEVQFKKEYRIGQTRSLGLEEKGGQETVQPHIAKGEGGKRTKT